MDKIFKKSLLDNQYFGIGLIAGVVITAIGFFLFNPNMSGLSKDEAGVKSIAYINNELLDGQATAKLDSVTETSSLYKIMFKVNEQPVTFYSTKDGKLLFPQAFEVDNVDLNTKSAETTAVTKSDKPKVELFVMSYCPYGTQIEKGILPVLSTLGDKIDFKLKFVNYAMHDKIEIDENLTQYCLQKEQVEKFPAYLNCFLKNGDSNSCLRDLGIDQTKLKNCIQNTDNTFKITEQFNKKQNYKGQFPSFGIDDADNIKYGVQGSPTLVINGSQVSSARDSASLLNTICSAFTTKPEICSTAKLSTDSPAPGFGETIQTGAQAAASCVTN